MSAIVYRYQGQPSEHYQGVPSRDLTADDLAVLSDEQRAAVEGGTLYVRTRAPEPVARPAKPVAPKEP